MTPSWYRNSVVGHVTFGGVPVHGWRAPPTMSLRLLMRLAELGVHPLKSGRFSGCDGVRHITARSNGDPLVPAEPTATPKSLMS